MPVVNPDGTVQASPPLASAFGPASASAPPPPVQAAPGTAPATMGASDPSFAGAIMALIHSLANFTAPKSITESKARTNQQIDKASE